MSQAYKKRLRGWLAQLSLSARDAVALSRIPDDVVAGFCEEMMGERVPSGLNAWYMERRLQGWLGACPVANTGYSRLVAHQLMMSDAIRVGAFANAIQEVVKPNDVVVDLGTGTGVLAILAARAGARQVFAIEREHVIALASRIASTNNASAITFVRGDASEINLPEAADVLVSECLGSGGVGTAQLNAVLEARRRLLRVGGVTIPNALSVVICPVESVLTDLYLRYWLSRPAELDFSEAASWARNLMYTLVVRPDELMSDPETVYHLVFSEQEKYSGFSHQCAFRTNRRGTVHGLAIWFVARLTDDIVLDTAPGRPLTHWFHCYLPLREGIIVEEGQELNVCIEHELRGDESVWDWSASLGPDLSTTKQSTGTGPRVGWVSTRAPRAVPLVESPADVLLELESVIKGRYGVDPSVSYTSRLLRGGLAQYGPKLREEADEVVRAAGGEGKERTIEEAADLIYHLFVLLRGEGIELEDVTGELRRRRK